MISSIVVAVDGSDHALNAQKVAVDLALKYGSKLTIVHVLTHDHPSEEMKRMVEVEHLAEPVVPQNISTPVTAPSIIGGMSGNFSSSTIEGRIIVALGEKIVAAAHDKAQAAGVKDVATEIRTGDYANCILETITNAEADMVVMGRRGLSTLKGFMTGSVSHKVSQRANCSVLTVK